MQSSRVLMYNAEECGIFPLKSVGVPPLRGPLASAMPAIQPKIANTAIRCDDSHGMERELHFAVAPLPCRLSTSIGIRAV